MLQTRTGSGSGMMPPAPQQNQQYGVPQQQRNYHASVGTTAPMSYRGSAAPIQPYAFTSTPSLTPTGQWQPHPNSRASSSSAVPTANTFIDQNGYPRSRHEANASLPNLPMNMAPGGSKDDSSIPSPVRKGFGAPRPQSAFFSNSTAQASSTLPSPVKSQPDRYRRPSHRGTESSSAIPQVQPAGSTLLSGPGMAVVGHMYMAPAIKERRPSPSSLPRPSSFYTQAPGTVDDMQLGRNPEESKRFRRRSMPALDAVEVPKSLAALDLKRPEKSQKSPTGQSGLKGAADKDKAKTARLVTMTTPTSARNGSSESLVSSLSSSSRPSSVSSPIGVHLRNHCPITENMQPPASYMTHADEC